MSKMLTFIIGGTRSGKSSFAEELAGEAGNGVVLIATGKPIDSEMKERIEKHKLKRPTNWRTIEADGDIPDIIEELQSDKSDIAGDESILVDCISFYVADLMNTYDKSEEEIVEHFKLIKKCLICNRDIVMVSSEVGFGVVPPYPLGREYRDTLGRVNQMIAESADKVIMMVAGIPLTVKNGRES